MIGKNQLIRDKELCAWLVSFTHDPRFEKVSALLRADFGEVAPTWEHLKGANWALDLMVSITDNPDAPQAYPTSGLDHRSPEQILRDAELHKEKE